MKEQDLKKRNAALCNVKLLLIFLVVYGHFIEERIQGSHLLMLEYRVIYFVHMPLFAFLSGMFLKEEKACLLQLKSALRHYLAFQWLYLSFARPYGESSPFVPYWHLWYLLSLACWSGVCWLCSAWLRIGSRSRKKTCSRLYKTVLVVSAVCAGCAAGNVQWIGREFSLSRTVVFLPYVLAGKFLPLHMDDKRLRAAGAVMGSAALAAAVLTESVMPVKMLYQADSYKAAGAAFGPLLRLLCYVVGMGLCLLLLAVTPRRKLRVSKAGIDTFWIYILHAPVVLMIRSISMDISDLGFICAAPLLSVWTICFLYKAGSWKKKLCAVA